VRSAQNQSNFSRSSSLAFVNGQELRVEFRIVKMRASTESLRQGEDT